MPGYQLELETIERLGTMLKAFERGSMAPTLRQHQTENYGPPIEPGLHVVEITGAASGGYYPGNFMEYSSGTWTAMYGVRVIEQNGSALSTKRYFAKVIGTVTISGTEFELYAAQVGSEMGCPHVSGVVCTGGYLAVTYGTGCDSTP